jgi:hypothetical protein
MKGRAVALGLIIACGVSLVGMAGLLLWLRASPPLLIVRMCMPWCGLANQMFRYAAGLGLQHSTGVPACVVGLDDSDYNAEGWLPHPQSEFRTHVVARRPLPECAPIFRLMHRTDVFRHLIDWFEPAHSTYVPLSRDQITGPLVVNGCMQSYKYFEALAPFFTLRQQPAADLWLQARGLTSVVHVRRGDKLLDGSPVVPLAYYERALRGLAGGRFAVCTDDPRWVRSQRVFENASLSLLHDPGFDMALLAGATDTVVIGIGSYGWWGAYLATRARRRRYYPVQYIGYLGEGYREADYIPPVGWEAA